jgi:hypothetical protein
MLAFRVYANTTPAENPHYRRPVAFRPQKPTQGLIFHGKNASLSAEPIRVPVTVSPCSDFPTACPGSTVIQKAAGELLQTARLQSVMPAIL